MKEILSLIKQYEPKPGEIWYHYCSAESFMTIIKNKTLRLCDILHMNDKTELLHGERLFYDILKDATIDDLKKEAIRSIYYAIREISIQGKRQIFNLMVKFLAKIVCNTENFTNFVGT